MTANIENNLILFQFTNYFQISIISTIKVQKTNTQIMLVIVDIQQTGFVYGNYTIRKPDISKFFNKNEYICKCYTSSSHSVLSSNVTDAMFTCDLQHK